MTDVQGQLAFNAFESQLKTLCLKEFPCGIGRWKETKKVPGKLLNKRKDLPEHKFSITLKDFGASHEKTETLEELVTASKSPWNLDYSWSNEAKQLREIAVRSPWLIDDKFVFSHFRTLRIVDKGVTEVDRDLLQFTCLEELSLSANLLQCVQSKHLPSSLRVLELCANQIVSLSELCIQPPPELMHLGLGFNSISMVDDYITGHYWPQLLSLDLCHNNLCDLMDIVKKLTSLPKLRNLILQGNPLSLVPGYRGYTIDSLRLLDILDDIPISADEKHHFKGLAKRREYILDEAKVVLKVDSIRGVPMPEELKNPEEQPEYPVISRKYFVQFVFLEDRTHTSEIFNMLHEGGLSSTTPSQAQNIELDMTENSLAESVGKTDALLGSKEDIVSHVADSSSAEKNVNFAKNLEKLPSTGRNLGENSVFTEDASLVDAADLQREDTTTPVRLAPIKSAACDWAEEIEVNWHKMVSRDDLLNLRDFFKDGMEIAVMEEKIESFPAEQTEEGASSPSGGKKGKGKDEKKDDKKRSRSRGSSAQSKGSEKSSKKSDGRKKSAERKKSADRKKDGKSVSRKDAKTPSKTPVDKKKQVAKDAGKDKKKKKGEPEIEMTSLPPEYTTLATFHIPLEDFLEGEFEFENTFTKASAESGTTTPASDMGLHKKDKKDKDKKKKPDSANKKGKERGKSPKGDKKDKGGKAAAGDKGGDKKGVTPGDGEDEPPPPPPPLQVAVAVKLHHWKTAMDSLKDERQSDGEGSGQSENVK